MKIDIREIEKEVDRDNIETDRVLVRLGFKLYKLCLKKQKQIISPKVTIDLKVVNRGRAQKKTIEDKVHDKVDADIFVKDFKSCLSEISPFFVSIFIEQHFRDKHNIEIFSRLKIGKSSFYEIQRMAERALTGELLLKGYSLNLILEMYEDMK